MHTFRLMAAAALLPVLAVAQAPTQTSKQTFKVIYATTDQDANEIYTSVRTIADVKGAMDNSRQFTAEGTADQLRTAEWVIRQLDLSAGPAPGATETLRNIADTRGDDTARVFFLSPKLTPQEFNEVMTAVRTITDIRRVFGMVARRAVVVRSSEEAVNAADWLLAEMMRDSSTGELVYPKKPIPEKDANHVRVLRYPRAKETQDFNEAMTMVRTLTDCRRVFGYLAKREIVLRCSQEELAAADWLLSQLDRDLPAAAPQVSPEFPAPYQVAANQPKEILRLFYFPAADTNETLVARATAIKAQAGVRRMFFTANPRVLGVGGTADQLAKIELIARQ